ncbi:MAG: response regulator [Alphaproteobacteria bacterium]|nr:response regulator [Alphaproteobacteria bacterium]
MSTVGQAFDSALEGLRTRYLAKLAETVAELDKLIAFCDLDALTPDIAAAAASLAHKLIGSGQTLGFPNVSRDAAVLETMLAADPLQPMVVSKAAKQLKATCGDYMRSGAPSALAPPPSAPPPAMAEDEAAEPPPLAGPSLIAIHADPAMARLLDDVFAAHAHIVTYPSIADAVAPAYPAGLLIVDLDSPGSQPNMLGELRNRPGLAELPILALTGQRKSAAVARAIVGTQLEALLKPVTPTELDAKVNAALQRRRLSVVIGDDDRIVRELLKARFETQGYQIHLAHDGEDVMTLARAHLPSIIVLDREMPKIEGLRVLGMLKADPATQHIPVIMLTSKGQAAEISEGRKAGAADYIVKPFAPDQVLARASQILGLPG